MQVSVAALLHATPQSLLTKEVLSVQPKCSFKHCVSDGALTSRTRSSTHLCYHHILTGALHTWPMCGSGHRANIMTDICGRIARKVVGMYVGVLTMMLLLSATLLLLVCSWERIQVQLHHVGIETASVAVSVAESTGWSVHQLGFM